MHDVIAGGFAGSLAQLFTWPLEYMKTIKQIPVSKPSGISFSQMMVTDIKTNGVSNIYRGIGFQSVFYFGRAGVRFGVYEKLKGKVSDYNINNNNKPELSSIQNFLCGIISGTMEAMLVMTPAEVIKVNTANNLYNNTQIPTSMVIKNIYKENGFAGFYRGCGPTILRQSSTQAISFMVFEKSKVRFERHELTKKFSSLYAGICGGIIAVLVNSPADTIKTQIQLGNSKYKNNNIIGVGREIIRRDGFRGFYTGMGFRLVKVVPLFGITFFTYDYLRDNKVINTDTDKQIPRIENKENNKI